MGDARPIPGFVVSLMVQNAMSTIGRMFDSIEGLAERVILVDSGSTDGTREYARSRGAEVVERAWGGNVAQRQASIDVCGNARWILLLDADESLEPPLAAALRVALERDDPAIAGYEINRTLWFHGEALGHVCQPEWRLRLVRGGRARAAGVVPHDRIELHSQGSTERGRIERLHGDLRHDSWSSAEDMLRRQLSHARAASLHDSRGGSLLQILVSPSAAFLKQFVLRRGFLDGRRGLIASSGIAAATLMKHILAAERKIPPSPGRPDHLP